MDQAGALGEIDAARIAFVDAVRRHDPATIAALYSDGARLVAPDLALLRGRGNVAAFWGAGIDTGLTDVELAPDDVDLVPGLAWEVGRYEVRFEAEEPTGRVELFDRGRYLLVYRLDDGRWTRAAEMFAPE